MMSTNLGSRDVDNQRASLINNFNKFVSYVTDINLKKIMSVVIFFLVSVLCGVSVSLGWGVIFALLLIGFSSVFLIAKPTLFFSVVIIFSLLGVGLFESFFNLSQANWIGFSLAAILFPSLFFYTWNVKDAGKVRLRRFDLYVISYLLAIVMSGLVNMTPPLQFIVGLKAYLPFLAVYFVLSPIIFSFDDFRRFLHIIIAIGCLQFVFNIYINFMIAPTIHGGMGQYESIIGTFGGSFYTGGYSGEHIIFLVLVFFATMLLHKFKLLSGKVLLLALVSLVVSVGLAETKVFFVAFVLVTIFFFYYAGERTYPISYSLIVSCSLLVILITIIYFFRFWSNESGGAEHAFLYSFDPDFMISPTQRGRVGAIVHWFTNVVLQGQLLHSLFGYGLGSSIGGALGTGSVVSGVGDAVKIFGPGLDVSALTKILWDMGGVGLITFTGVSMYAIKVVNATIDLSKNKNILCLAIVFKVWLIILLLTLPYQPGIVGGVAFQFLFWFSVGAIRYLARHNELYRGD